MEMLMSLFVTVAGGVVCHLIVKWLDSNDTDNKQPGGCFATVKEKKNPPTVFPYGWGIRSLFKWTAHILLPIGIIAYANFNCKILQKKIPSFLTFPYPWFSSLSPLKGTQKFFGSLFPISLRQPDQQLRDLVHGLDAGIFKTAVIIRASGTEIGTGKPHKGKP